MASKEKNSATVRGAGFLAAFWMALEKAIREAGGSDEDIHRLGTEEGADTLHKMARVAALRGECEVVESAPVPTTYQVTVDYEKTLEEMIAAGRYDLRNDDITQERFPFQGTGQVEVELHIVHLNKVMSMEEVLAELDRRGLRPATLPELLALGAKYPNLQKEFSILALGSVLHDDRSSFLGFAWLGGWSGGRQLSLDWNLDHGVWLEPARFLAVSK